MHVQGFSVARKRGKRDHREPELRRTITPIRMKWQRKP